MENVLEDSDEAMDENALGILVDMKDSLFSDVELRAGSFVDSARGVLEASFCVQAAKQAKANAPNAR